MNDLIMRNKSLKFAPITDALGFLTAIANTYALSQVLFTHTSLLTMGLEGLLTIMMRGHHSGKLHNIGQYQKDWYAHILWMVYEVCVEYLKQHLTKTDLLAGACLANPFTSFNREITCLPPYENSGCPICICNPITSWSAPPNNTAQAHKQSRTRMMGSGGAGPNGGSRGSPNNGGGNSGNGRGPAMKKS